MQRVIETGDFIPLSRERKGCAQNIGTPITASVCWRFDKTIFTAREQQEIDLFASGINEPILGDARSKVSVA